MESMKREMQEEEEKKKEKEREKRKDQQEKNKKGKFQEITMKKNTTKKLNLLIYRPLIHRRNVVPFRLPLLPQPALHPPHPNHFF